MKKYSCLLIFLLILTTSCTITKSLWNRGYVETFRQFLVDSVGQKIVFLGTNYHYIFNDDSRIILELLNSKSRSSLFINTKKTRIRLNRKNQIRANISVEVIDNKFINHEEYHTLESLGFRNNAEGNLAISLELQGMRYSAENWRGKNLGSLDRTYVIKIQHDNTLFGAIAKAALTPITVTADAFLLIGKTALFPFKSN